MSAPTSVGCSATYPALQEHTAASHPWGIIVRTRLAYPLLLGRLSATTLISTSGGDIRTRLPRQILARPQSQRQKIKHHQTPSLPNPPPCADRYMQPCLCQLSLFIILVITMIVFGHFQVFLTFKLKHSPRPGPRIPAFSKCLCCCVLLCAKHIGSMRRVFRTVP
jgi:hypothetical protein